MKKTIAMLLSLVMLLTIACGALAEEGADVVICGELAKPGLTEEDVDRDLNNHISGSNRKSIYYDNLTSLLMALNANKIAAISDIPVCVANYVAAHNDQYIAIEGPYSICLQIGLAEGNDELLASFNAAITKLTEDGTIDTLTTEYIDSLAADAEPVPAEMPVFDGAQTVRVVVTGDLPPLDYVSADGKPAGFNVALLSALSKEMNVNIELVLSDAGSRAAMLTSDRADAIFWMRVSDVINEAGEVLATHSEAPEGIALTNTYFRSSAGGLKRK